MDDGCKKFAEDLKTFKYAKYKTAGSKTLSLGAKESETCEFGNYKVTVKVKEITEEKVKISMVFLKGNEEVGKQTVTLTPGGKAQLTEIDEGNSKATLFALGVAKNK
jgi:hypothetical protein